MHSIAVFNSTVLDLKCFLNPSVPFVWIVDYMPVQKLAWYSSTLQLNEKDVVGSLQVRPHGCDLLLDTSKCEELLEMLNDSNGITIIQMSKKVPDTLINSVSPEIPQYLFSNGFYSQFYLPHRNEVSIFQCIDHQWIEHVSKSTTIRGRLL